MSIQLRRDKLKLLPLEIASEALYFPLWWYSQGIFNIISFFISGVTEAEHRLGLRIWIKNIFTPMYGQYDWEGRIISFFMRVVQIIARSIMLVVWVLLYAIIVAIWLVLPVISVSFIIYNFISIVNG